MGEKRIYHAIQNLDGFWVRDENLNIISTPNYSSWWGFQRVGDYIYLGVNDTSINVINASTYELVNTFTTTFSFGDTWFIDGDYIYLPNRVPQGGLSIIYRYNINTFNYVDEVEVTNISYLFGLLSQHLHNDENENCFWVTRYNGKIHKISKTDLSILAVYDDTYGGIAGTYTIVSHPNYIFADGYVNGNQVYIRYDRDLNYLNHHSAGNYIIGVIGDYLYGFYSNYVRKFDFNFNQIATKLVGTANVGLHCIKGELFVFTAYYGLQLNPINLNIVKTTETYNSATNVSRRFDYVFNTLTLQNLLPPTNITVTNITYTGATVNWVNNITEDLECTGNRIDLFTNNTWSIIDTVSSGITTYDLINLIPNTNDYAVRIISIGIDNNNGISESVSFETPDPSPYNLQAIDVDYFSAEIQWELPDPYGDEIQVQIREVGVLTTAWTTVDTLSNTATGYTITNLNDNTIYDCRVVLIGSEYPSNTIQFTTLEIVYPKSFCEGINYIVSGATCGNSTGTIFISNIDYLILYDFKLEDIDGNSYELSDNAFKGLTSNYYFLSATPKPAYWSTYGKTPCTFEWIKIESTDTTLSLTNKYVENAMCQGFGKGRGRIGYVFADTETAPDYNLKIYTTSKQLVYDETVSGLTLPFIYYGTPLCYNAVLTNGNGCTYFVDSTCLQGLNSMTVEGIDELYLTKYNSDLTINYWGLEDEDYYIGGYDSNFYTSTKIKEILNYDVWYQIPLNAADARYTQQLIRGRNGITYEESIDIVVHHKDVQKWLDMIALLRDRYVIVFKDNNDNWWTFAYESGTKIRQYRLEENAYKFTFFQPAVTKLLTAISEDYVNTYIK